MPDISQLHQLYRKFIEVSLVQASDQIEKHTAYCLLSRRQVEHLVKQLGVKIH